MECTAAADAAALAAEQLAAARRESAESSREAAEVLAEMEERSRTERAHWVRQQRRSASRLLGGVLQLQAASLARHAGAWVNRKHRSAVATSSFRAFCQLLPEACATYHEAAFEQLPWNALANAAVAEPHEASYSDGAGGAAANGGAAPLETASELEDAAAAETAAGAATAELHRELGLANAELAPHDAELLVQLREAHLRLVSGWGQLGITVRSLSDAWRLPADASATLGVLCEVHRMLLGDLAQLKPLGAQAAPLAPLDGAEPAEPESAQQESAQPEAAFEALGEPRTSLEPATEGEGAELQGGEGSPTAQSLVVDLSDLLSRMRSLGDDLILISAMLTAD